jgi:hypothetical protein
MKRRIDYLIAAFFILVGISIVMPSRNLSAHPKAEPGGCVIPRSWGAYKGLGPIRGSNYPMVFEDSTGNVRMINPDDCNNVLFEIRRQ